MPCKHGDRGDNQGASLRSGPRSGPRDPSDSLILALMLFQFSEVLHTRRFVYPSLTFRTSISRVEYIYSYHITLYFMLSIFHVRLASQGKRATL
jgi:hypothetical protein